MNKTTIKMARAAYFYQTQRCYNKNNNGYKYYGNKGIRIEYAKDEFVSWFIDNYDLSDEERYHVGRINHDKNYSLDNIELVTKRENSAERCRRHGSPGVNGPNKGITAKKRVYIHDKSTKECLAIAESIAQAARLIGSHPSRVSLCVNNKAYSSCGYLLKDNIWPEPR